MTIIQAQVSDDLLAQLQTIAQQESLSIEQVVSQALAVQATAWLDRDTLQRRAQQGSWEHFQTVLAKVPNREPEAFDRL
jgi:predicted transcriptional regulator